MAKPFAVGRLNIAFSLVVTLRDPRAKSLVFLHAVVKPHGKNNFHWLIIAGGNFNRM